MNRLAWLYAKKGVKIGRGLELIEKVIQSNPSRAKYIDTLAELLFAKGDIDGAVKNIKEVLRIEPDNSYYKQQLWKFQNMLLQPLDVNEF